MAVVEQQTRDKQDPPTGLVNRLERAVRALMTWFGHHEPHLLVLLILAAAAVWGFAELADEVMEGETRAFDETVLLAMRTPGDVDDPWGPRWVEELGRDFTALGGIGVLALITFAAAGYLALRGKRRALGALLLAVGTGVVASNLLKQAFDRPRPDLVPHASEVYSASFPSGHSMMAAVTYLTLAVMLARVERRFFVRAYLLALAVMLALLVGVSRVYVGVHWPTDVLAGWAIGAAWALLCWAVMGYLQRRGAVEPEADDAEVDEDTRPADPPAAQVTRSASETVR